MSTSDRTNTTLLAPNKKGYRTWAGPRFEKKKKKKSSSSAITELSSFALTLQTTKQKKQKKFPIFYNFFFKAYY